MSKIKDVDSMNMMDENPELRWSFISKVYSILTLQLLLTIAVVSVVVFVPLVANFFNNYVPDYVLGIVVVFAQCSAELYHQKHLLSYFLLLIFNVSFALLLGSFCAFLSGQINLEAVILTTTAVVFILTLYTFWAVKRGQDFQFLNPFLLRALLVLFIIVSIQILFPLEKFMSTMIIVCFIMIFGCLVFIKFCCNIVYNTDTLINRISYAMYISVSISLYLDIITLFLSLCILYPLTQLPLLQKKPLLSIVQSLFDTYMLLSNHLCSFINVFNDFI